MEEYRHQPRQQSSRQTDPAAAGLELVERTAELIRATEDHAAEMAARSAAAVAHLQEEMRLAERVLEAAETRRRVAEAEVKELRTSLEEMKQAYEERIEKLNAEQRASLEESERAYEERVEAVTAEMRSSLEESERTYEERLDNLTAELAATQQRATHAEERATEAERALERVQNAMQGILQSRPSPPGASPEPQKRELGSNQDDGSDGDPS